MNQKNEQPPDWKTRFQFALRWQEGLADSSMVAVYYELEAWQLWLRGRQLTWDVVSSDDLRVWLQEQRPRYAYTTLNKKIWIIRRLYGWAAREKLIAANPWLKIARPRQHPKILRRFVPSVRQVERLLEQPDVRTPKGLRDRAILELLYASGLRAAELLALGYWQVMRQREDHCIRIVGKGGRERMVVYGERAAMWLQHYAENSRPDLLVKAGAVNSFFVNSTSSGFLRYGTLRVNIKKYAVAAKLPLLTAHSLRHAFATHMYANGADLRSIQMLLGHRHLATTAIYATPPAKRLRKLIEQHHPSGSQYKASTAHRQRRGVSDSSSVRSGTMLGANSS